MILPYRTQNGSYIKMSLGPLCQHQCPKLLKQTAEGSLTIYLSLLTNPDFTK